MDSTRFIRMYEKHTVQLHNYTFAYFNETKISIDNLRSLVLEYYSPSPLKLLKQLFP